MGSILRSEEMALAQLFLQPEAAYFIISELGESGCVQFKDLNENVNSFQRRFVNEVRRCDDMQRRLKVIEAEIKKDCIFVPDINELPKAPNPREVIDLEAHFEKIEGDILELSESAVTLKSNFLELTELKYVLEKTQNFFLEHNQGYNLDMLITEDSQHVRSHLDFVAGVINRKRLPAFERMLWRVSRGNIFLKQADIETPLEDPATGHDIQKTVFAAFFQGEQLKIKLKKICDGFHASLYPCSSTTEERNDMLKDIRTRLQDLEMVLNQTKDHRHRLLLSVAKEIANWGVMVSKMKAIYHTLNFFTMDVIKECLLGECWMPRRDMPIAQKALADGSNVCGSSISSILNVINTAETPPTYTRTNKFTAGFQILMDSYGIASYREVNPGLFSIITFPFLFGVMFGDSGHAMLMIAFALWMVLSEKKISAMKNKDEISRIFFGGRWYINASRFDIGMDDDKEHELLPKADYLGTPYVMGLDPIWQTASNKIIFQNSFKMKLSIVLGIVHMIFGVCISVVNFIHFKRYYSIFLEFLPQLLFLVFLFLYLVVMIFLKWFIYSGELDGWIPEEVNKHGSSCAPSVLIYFINMFLMGESEPNDKCDTYMYEGQRIVQFILLFGALICIPVMLLGKPLYLMCQRNRTHKLLTNTNSDVAIQSLTVTDSDDNIKSTSSNHHEDTEEDEEEPVSDLFIYQAIHTIEYTLSTVSHTASYLRLWALSLAHAQLSEVLWNRVFRMGLAIFPGYMGAVTAFLAFAVWAFFTVNILVLMEGLSAFLHTLRLHWVEFMSKFYEGVGYVFQPFSFKLMLEEEGAEK
ncbi:hypothetical protein NQ315_011610 [Exocentrus adspersus]|uniref:V-type proton ATPase subunit a n=1 Tax=Exocentrus adspersus TaxID=1586481 RepID=A0AAV8VV95_9CUCU|nr:hypothetical protein NQ315_011610 [Exocentrus adspersus]